MRALIVIVEGQTEEEFVNTSLSHYLFSQGIYDVRPIKIETSPGHKGGLVDYIRYKRDATNYLKREKDIIVTSMVDFFRLPSQFPRYAEAQKIVDVVKRIEFLEKAIAEDINNYRFIPYIQLHEFEGLLFSDKKGFSLFSDIHIMAQIQLDEIFAKYSNPELINEGAETAPSKRLQRLITGYQKTFHGPMIALENGIEPILEKCPRFRAWINSIITAMKK